MNSRRNFLRNLAITATAPLIVCSRALSQDAPPAVKLEPTDPVAVALGYKEDATQVDATKYPQYKPGSKCDGCALYQGKPGEPNGPCSVFSNKIVTAGGWCMTYAPKPPAPATPAPPAQ